VTSRRLFPLTLAGLFVAAALVAAGLLITHSPVRALPPAGTDYVYIRADVHITSRIGTETVHLEGVVNIVRQAPHTEGGVDVVDATITQISLTGTSVAGPVTVSQSADFASNGKIRSLQPSQEYPASAFFDLALGISVPESPHGSLMVHNERLIHLVNTSNVTAWPPYGTPFEMQLVPQTTPTPTATPGTPAPTATPIPGLPDCSNGIRLLRDHTDFRDPDPWLPSALCVTQVSAVMSVAPSPTPTVTPTATRTPCVPTCTPTPTPTGPTATNTPPPLPSPTPTRTPGPFPPGDTTFSVAPGGPSGRHPADLLARGPSTVPIAVSGNDNFSNVWQVGNLPFNGRQSTTGFTTELGEPLTVAPAPNCIPTPPNVIAATAWYRFTPTSSGTVNISTSASDYDTVLAVYTGSALNALTMVACDDDTANSFTSLVSFPVASGVTYYVQSGGFPGGSQSGQLRISISMAGGGAGGAATLHTAISCTNLGLTAAGCSTSGPQDDLDALSFGHDFASGTAPFQFSVAPGSTGRNGSAVAIQAACTPPEPQADIFSSARDGTNSLIVDGDGAANNCPSATPLNLIERPASDNLDAISGEPPSQVDTDNDGILDRPVYFSLAPGSPSLAALSRGPADILWTGGFQPGLYASAAQLGLQASDQIDGICISHSGSGQAYDPAHDKVLFSLAPGSPTLSTLGASGADLLAPGPKVFVHAWELGLKSTDNVDALHCAAGGPPAVIIPTGDFYFCDPSYQGGVCDTVIRAGDTVTWNFASTAHHTTTECGASCDSPTTSPLWDSGPVSSLDASHTFSHVFNTPGTYLYYCSIHPNLQRGRIIVQPAGGPTPTPTPGGLIGDANKDGTVNSIDAALVLQYSAGLIGSINPRADANQNGTVNAIDATLILQYVAGLISHLPP
jgi:hypothetical protein